MPAGREDVREEDEVGFVGGTGGEGEAVEIGVGDAEALGLAALVGAHCYIAIGATCEASDFNMLV